MKKLTAALIVILFLMNSASVQARGFDVADETIKEEIKELQEENSRLKRTLDYIYPREDKLIYENPYRLYGNNKPKNKGIPLSQVLTKGQDIKFNKIYDNPKYVRPIYSSNWKDFAFRGWLEVSDKISEGIHRLLMFPLGASANFDFTGSLGFSESLDLNNHRNINLLIYDFKVEQVKRYKNQVALIGKPSRSGAEVISIVKDDLLYKEEKEEEVLFQLSTPQGYEVDFIYDNVLSYEYLMEQIKKNSVRSSSSTITEEKSLEELKEENRLLKRELSYYIPLKEHYEPVVKELLITKKNCKSFSYVSSLEENIYLNELKNKGKEISFKVNYEDKKYSRPLYDPTWKAHYKEGLMYIPRKMCEAMQRVFLIPKDVESKDNLFKGLGFKELYSKIEENEVGLLLYSFNPEKAIVLDNQILIIGTPSRTGANIISFNKDHLDTNKRYIVRLITLDNLELDFQYLNIK